MILTFDYHTHTVYSHGHHGKGTILENAVSAREKGILGIGITDHGFSHLKYGVKRSDLTKMRAECSSAQQETGVKVLLGVESNILGESGKCDVEASDYENIDLFLAGCHRFVRYDKFKEWFTILCGNSLRATFNVKPPDSLVKRMTDAYINAIKNNPIDILTHINYLVFADAVEVAKCARDYGTYIEINTKKQHLSDETWRAVIDTGVNFVVDSDAHTPDRVGDTAIFDDLIKRVDFPLERIHNINGKVPDFRFTAYKNKM